MVGKSPKLVGLGLSAKNAPAPLRASAGRAYLGNGYSKATLWPPVADKGRCSYSIVKSKREARPSSRLGVGFLRDLRARFLFANTLNNAARE